MSRFFLSALILLVVLPGAAFAASEVQGSFFISNTLGGATETHGWYEERVYLAAPELGAPGATTAANPPGWFSIKAPGGRDIPTEDFMLFHLRYDGIPAFSFREITVDVPIAATAPLEGLEFDTSAHYSVMYNRGPEEWGEGPWVQGTDFYQTFIAKSPHITRIATKLADKTPEYTAIHLNYAVYETTDGPPSEWKQISPTRSRYLSPTTDPIIHIFWVPFRSNEMTLTVGEKYAVRLWRGAESESEEFALVARRDNGDGYANGMLHQGDAPLPGWDAYLYVSGGIDGTVVNHAPVGAFETGELLGWNESFGQTFVASGSSLAAVDIIFARGMGMAWDIPVTFQVYDAPGGKAIGPPRTGYGIQGAFQSRAAVLWDEGEVPLEPGETYYIEGKSEGLNIWPMNEDMPGVHAFIDGEAREDADLMMSIAEYVKVAK